MSQISRRAMIKAGTGLSLAAATGLVRPAAAQETVMGDAYSVMSSDERLTTWVQLIDAGGLQQYARAPRPYTIFPASDQAFAKYPQIMKDLLGYQYVSGSHNDQAAFPDTSKIVKFVRSHVVAGKHMPSEMMGHTETVTTIAGTPLTFNGSGNPVTISWTSVDTGQQLIANLVDMPIVCTNAVIYILDNIDVV